MVRIAITVDDDSDRLRDTTKKLLHAGFAHKVGVDNHFPADLAVAADDGERNLIRRGIATLVADDDLHFPAKQDTCKQGFHGPDERWELYTPRHVAKHFCLSRHQLFCTLAGGDIARSTNDDGDRTHDTFLNHRTTLDQHEIIEAISDGKSCQSRATLKYAGPSPAFRRILAFTLNHCSR